MVIEEWDDLMGFWMTNSDVECVRQCHFVVLSLDERNDLNDVFVEHQTDVLSIGT